MSEGESVDKRPRCEGESVDKRPWCWNVENRERYERADSREDAIRQAVAFYAAHYNGIVPLVLGDGPARDPEQFTRAAQDSVQIGRLDLYNYIYTDGEFLLESMALNAQDECGEAAEDWPDASDADIDALGKAVDGVIQEWLTRTGNVPAFGYVSDIEHPSGLEVQAVILKYGITPRYEER
ncbi:MAG: hypothetical protein ACRD1X_22150 [Vicinamibacteria bacterium]